MGGVTSIGRGGVHAGVLDNVLKVNNIQLNFGPTAN